MPKTIRSEFRPFAQQRAYLTSTAKIRGYGGALGGGKSRTLCEDAFNQMLEYPGIVVLLCRQAHTSIVETTKKTMVRDVVPPSLVANSKASQGEDYIELWNGSRCHFVGLDNPLRWFSSEIGFIGFDEAQETRRDDVVLLIGRLRQQGMPHRASFTFNPSSPGHWLQQWFLLGGEPTPFGFRKDELFVSEDAVSSMGTCEFFFAKATDNKYLPDGYIEQTVAGFPAHMRRRYLEGLWEYSEGNSFFAVDDLGHYQKLAGDSRPVFTGRTEGDPSEDFAVRQRGKGQPAAPCRFRPGSGQWTVWRKPVKDHRYVMAVDTSSGGSYDYSAIQIVCVDTFEQVAEYQGKIAPAELAVEAYRAGRVFNNATAVPEITGGYGFSVMQELQRLHYPSTYTRRVFDRLAKRFTDKLGWDTTTNMRAHMLDTLYRVLSERELGLYGIRTVNELATFVYGKNDKPQAQDGCNDDLVVALAIAVTVAVDRPKSVKKPVVRRRDPVFAATGYGA